MITKQKILVIVLFLGVIFFNSAYAFKNMTDSSFKELNENLYWQVGFGRKLITPTTQVWLAGYGNRERAPLGKIHDLWVKVMALKNSEGKRVVLVTTDHMGMSKTVYENIYSEVHRIYNLKRSEFMLTFSHNHCGPRITDDLVDYYPFDQEQEQLVREYTKWMESQVVEAVGDALKNWKPAKIFRGEGLCTFAVNRRDNEEKEVPDLIAKNIPLKGVVDHEVPVLAIKSQNGKLLGVLFGYACHPTTLSFNYWCGDYPGFAQINLEEKYPDLQAMFFNAAGADINPLPRRKIELCRNYGKMLSDAVDQVLQNSMTPVTGELNSAFKYVDLTYEEVATAEKLDEIAKNKTGIPERWAKRLLKIKAEGMQFNDSYPYPVQVWNLGNDLLFIAIGGEAVVDYSLRFKREFGKGTWVCGYANEMVAYIPSRRVWEEGGYEGGPHLDEYGHPAWRWNGKVEKTIADAVHKLVKKVNKEE